MIARNSDSNSLYNDSYQCDLNSNLTLLQVIIHWVSKKLPWNYTRLLSCEEEVELKSIAKGIEAHEKHLGKIYTGISSLTDDVRAFFYKLKRDVKEVLESDKVSDSELTSIKRRFERLDERLAKLDEIQSQLISDEKYAKKLHSRGKQLIACYDTESEKLTTIEADIDLISDRYEFETQFGMPITLQKYHCDIGLFRHRPMLTSAKEYYEELACLSQRMPRCPR